jgi:hypothetical protein
VIVIPGILGSELINSKTGEKVWPSAFRTAEDGLPMTPDLISNRDDLVPGKIIETVKLAACFRKFMSTETCSMPCEPTRGITKLNGTILVLTAIKMPSTSSRTTGDKTMLATRASWYVALSV